MTYITWHDNITWLHSLFPQHCWSVPEGTSAHQRNREGMQHTLLKKDPKDKKTPRNPIFCECVWFCAFPATVASVGLEITEFQIVMFIMSIKSTFLAVDLSFICLFYLAPGKLWGLTCIWSGSRAYCIWEPISNVKWSLCGGWVKLISRPLEKQGIKNHWVSSSHRRGHFSCSNLILPRKWEETSRFSRESYSGFFL